MADPVWEFDPTSEDATNAPLTLSTANGYGVTDFNADVGDQSVQWASSVDTEGALPASVKDDNRVVSLTVECTTVAALRALQAKVAKIGRERGTLKYTLPDGLVIVFDLLSRQAFRPVFDVGYFINSGAYCQVTFGFTARPSCRGPQQSLTLSLSTATAGAPLVFTASGVKGDMPARGTLNIGNVSNLKTTAIWGVQSRNYNAASTAALFFEAENTDSSSGTAAADPGSSGASGGGTNKVKRHSNVGTSSSLAFALATSGPTTLTHVGTFRVIARVQALSTNSGITSIQLGWLPDLRTPGIQNDWVPIQTVAGVAIKGSWVLADLGLVSIPRARKGTQGWLGLVSSKSTVATDDIDFDWVMLVPVDEGSGRLDHTTIGVPAGGVFEVAYDTAQLRDASTYWYSPTKYEGDYLLVPPAGAENRTVRFVVALAGPGSVGGNVTGTIVDANNMDAITATVTYEPRYLVVPSP